MVIYINQLDAYIEDLREEDKPCRLYEGEIILEVKQKRIVYAKNRSHAEELLTSGECEDKDIISEEIIMVDKIKLSE